VFKIPDGELTLCGMASLVHLVWNRLDNKILVVPQMLRELGLAGFKNCLNPLGFLQVRVLCPFFRIA
jgi:hypothetical protein